MREQEEKNQEQAYPNNILCFPSLPSLRNSLCITITKSQINTTEQHRERERERS